MIPGARRRCSGRSTSGGAAIASGSCGGRWSGTAQDGARKDWEEEAGWTDAKGEPTVKKKWFDARWKNPWETEDLSGYTAFGLAELIKGVQSELSYTACDVLDFQTPALAPCDKLTEHPVAPAATDGNIFQAIARLDLAIADPGRQAELFGWTTPNAADLPVVVAFEKAKTDYWNLVCDSAFKHLEILKETADFKAANLLRVLYLAGETPPHIAGASPIWRQPAALGRNVNFSAAVQVRIEQLLLEFKYWGDDPFYVDGGFNAADKDNIRAHRTAAIEEERRQEAMHKTVEGRPLTPQEIENEVKADIGDKKLNYEMTFWSENHQLLFASAEFLAGQWMPDKVFRAGLRHRGEGPEGSRPGDLTGEQRMRQAKKRLIRWLDDRLRLGFSEWNAPGYYAEDLEPLFNLVDFCQDQDIRGRALMVLDLMIFDLARFSLRGSFGVTAGRCYYNQKMCGYDQSVGDLIEILFGTRDGVIVWDGGESSGAFASSRGYTVPDVLVKVGQDRPVRMVDRSRSFAALRRSIHLRHRLCDRPGHAVLVEPRRVFHEASRAHHPHFRRILPPQRQPAVPRPAADLQDYRQGRTGSPGGHLCHHRRVEHRADRSVYRHTRRGQRGRRAVAPDGGLRTYPGQSLHVPQP